MGAAYNETTSRNGNPDALCTMAAAVKADCRYELLGHSASPVCEVRGQCVLRMWTVDPTFASRLWCVGSAISLGHSFARRPSHFNADHPAHLRPAQPVCKPG